MERRVAIIGSGAWGTALGVVAAHAGVAPLLFSRSPETVEEINTRHLHTIALPGVLLPTSLQATRDWTQIQSYPIILLAVPAQETRGVCKVIRPLISAGAQIIATAKGIEHNSCALMSDVIESELPGCTVSILSGPTFAQEVARGLPAAATLAVADNTVAPKILPCFLTSTFRLYITHDRIGAQVGGAVKNVLAIAAGIVVGKGLGDNACAALISRGLAELMRLGVALGGKPETFLGLSGCGDVVLTCTSYQSRNMSYGRELVAGSPQKGILREGVLTAQTLTQLAKNSQVDMPICEAVTRLVTHQSSLEEEIKILLERPLKYEVDFSEHIL